MALTMQYSRLIWNHSSSDEPVEIVSEYDSDGWERRKVEFFQDGSAGYAGEGESSGNCELSLIQRPADEDAIDVPELRITELTKSEFETAWKLAQRSLVSAK